MFQVKKKDSREFCQNWSLSHFQFLLDCLQSCICIKHTNVVKHQNPSNGNIKELREKVQNQKNCLNQAQLFIWKIKYTKAVKSIYFIKTICSSRTAQWRYESSLKKHLPLQKKERKKK